MSATILQFPHRVQRIPLTKLQQENMDASLERAINDSHEQLLAAKTEEGQRHWFETMKRLCSLRSARKIAAMEREKGLR